MARTCCLLDSTSHRIYLLLDSRYHVYTRDTGQMVETTTTKDQLVDRYLGHYRISRIFVSRAICKTRHILTVARLSACFGIESEESTWCEYQSSLSSTWGSAAYLTSALLQWYESVTQGPVLAFPNNRVPALLR